MKTSQFCVFFYSGLYSLIFFDKIVLIFSTVFIVSIASDAQAFKLGNYRSTFFFLNSKNVNTFHTKKKKYEKRILLRRRVTNPNHHVNYLFCKNEKENELKEESDVDKTDKDILATKGEEKEQNIVPLNMDWIKVISLISKSNDVEAMTLAFNASLSAVEKKGCLTTMLELFETMKRKNIKPDLVSYKLILNLCDKYHLIENAEMLYEEMTENDKILPNYEIYSIMISCFSKRGYANKAIEFFEKLRNDPFIEGRKKINTTVDPKRFEKWKKENENFLKENNPGEKNEEHIYNKHFSELSNKIKKVEATDTKIEYSEYANVIYACNLANAHNEGIKYFEELLSHKNYIPSIFIFENMFDLLSKNGNYKKAFEYYNKLKNDPNLKNNISVNILNNLLKTLSITNKINIIEEIWNNEFDELLLTPNDISYQLILKVYGEIDAYEKSFKLFKEMQIKKMLHKNNLLPFLYTINSFKNCGIYNYAIYVLRIAKYVDVSNDDLVLLYNNVMVVCINAKKYDVIISLYAELIKLQQKDVSFHLNINTLSFVLLAFRELNMMEDYQSLKNLIIQRNYKLTPLCVKLFDEKEKK